MRSFRRIVGLVLALSAIPAAAHGQNPQQRIDAARRTAESRQIPVTLLDSKVAEGRAKGVPLDRIAAAVERRLESLTRARDVMVAAPRTAPVTHGDLSVGADAIEAGVEPAVLGRLTTVAPANQRAVAISVLMQLVAEGESSEQALARVTTALQHDPEGLTRLPGQATAERGRGNAHGQQGGRGNNPGRGNSAGGRGRGQGGPPASVPGPAERPGRGRDNNPGKGRP